MLAMPSVVQLRTWPLIRFERQRNADDVSWRCKLVGSGGTGTVFEKEKVSKCAIEVH